jgi:hypothetical protein
MGKYKVWIIVVLILVVGGIVMVVVKNESNKKIQSTGVDYSKKDNWVFHENDVDGKDADIFVVCSTAIEGDDTHFNMDLADEEMRTMFKMTTALESGTYGDKVRVFAPYYRQIGLSACYLSEGDREKYFDIGFKDVQDAFEYYMEHYNNGRPFILAGYSQGAQVCLKLMKENMKEKARQDLLVACYAIGWKITDEDLEDYPQIKMATGETDTGVVVSYDCEAESVKSSFIIPEGVKVHSINPLNWKTDSTPADKSLHKGACIADENCNIVQEIDHFTGCYIDETRGSLKVTDVPIEEFSLDIDIFGKGDYHWFDLQFFYNNIKENVSKRIDAYMKQ